MDVKMYMPFIEAFYQVLPQFGFSEVKRGNLRLSDRLTVTMQVTALIGLSKDVRGNVAYCMTEATAKNVASRMMGMPVETFDEMARSAIAELSNILTSSAAILYEKNSKIFMDISPPALITGDNVTLMGQIKALTIEFFTDAGLIETNVGLEDT
ncbi:MAG: chemotaxis protein CheX [Bacillota bacterium]